MEGGSRLDFCGEPSIWDGQLIKRRLVGNYALYILTDKVWFTLQVTDLVTLGTALGCAVQIIYRLKSIINNTIIIVTFMFVSMHYCHHFPTGK